MFKNEDWHKMVLRASKRFARGVLRKPPRYAATKEDIERVKGRVLAQVIDLASKRFTKPK
jgi:hypothetical protein